MPSTLVYHKMQVINQIETKIAVKANLNSTIKRQCRTKVQKVLILKRKRANNKHLNKKNESEYIGKGENSTNKNTGILLETQETGIILRKSKDPLKIELRERNIKRLSNNPEWPKS